MIGCPPEFAQCCCACVALQTSKVHTGCNGLIRVLWACAQIFNGFETPVVHLQPAIFHGRAVLEPQSVA